MITQYLLIIFNVIQIYFSLFTCSIRRIPIFKFGGEAEASVSLCVWKGKGKEE